MRTPRQLFERRAKSGTLWEGPASIFDGAEVGFAHGFYAMTDDGQGLLLRGGLPVRLTMVDDAPGDALNGACHLEVAGPNDPPTKPGRIVPLTVEPIVGRASVDGG